jgi:predicted O-linked N-acetylglucosamine transferase (SPINDLY family)
VTALDVDIAVDLNGYTEGARTGVLARRVAPIQVNFLGYPGTSGGALADYIVADRTVIPENECDFFSESVVYLPDTYFPNDSTREIAGATPTRASERLPAQGLVFCSFNNSYKNTPRIFDIWMRLLRSNDNSVLWLREANAVATANLRREAQKRGVSADRLVFAQRVDPAEHLARHRLADLFLDTVPYNAHATAADALWAGLPVVTCAGPTFAGRVAASLLNAVGLPELVTRSLEDYEALALKLAWNPTLLAAAREKLSHNRLRTPLFDTARFTRHFEAALAGMYERHRRGKPPEGFSVEVVE